MTINKENALAPRIGLKTLEPKVINLLCDLYMHNGCNIVHR